MFLDVSKALRDPGQEYPFRVEQEIASQEIGGEVVTFDPAVMEGVLFAAGENVTVDGTLKTTAHAHCANCLAPADVDVTASYRETFLRGGDPEDDEIFAYEGSKIDFTKLAMSVAILELPMRILCKEGCSGLWKEYGVSDAPNACQKELPNEHPFAALQQLLTKDEEV